MTETPQSQRYSFKELVAENDLTQSWIAVNRDIGRNCFVKVPSPGGSLGRADKLSFLKTSFNCQRRIRSREVLRASAQYRESKTVFIEYPYLDGSEWRVVSPEVFFRHLDPILIEASVTMDYIHLLGLIHGDAKLDNFLVNSSSSRFRMVLADLDFLRPESKKLTAKVFGTPDLIAPEVLANEAISGLSDNYSLGLSLKSHLESIASGEGCGADSGISCRENLRRLVTMLTQEDPNDRPAFLVDALLECGLIDDSAFSALNRRLLYMQLLANYCVHLRRRAGVSKRFQRFLMEVCKVHGVPEEILSDIEEAHGRHRLKAFRLASKLLLDAHIDRYCEYWYVSLSDDQMEEGYCALADLGLDKDRLPAGLPPRFSPSDFEGMKKRVASLQDRGHHLKAYISLRMAQRQVESLDSGLDQSVRVDLLADMGQSAAAIGRTEESSRYCELAGSQAESDSARYFDLLREAVYQNLLLGKIEHASELMESVLARPERESDRAKRNEFRRLAAWVSGAKGELEESERVLNALLKEAVEVGDTVLQTRIYSDLGTRHWRGGNFAKAEECYRKSIKIAVDAKLYAETSSPFSNMSMLCFEILEYRRSVKYGKLALKALTRPADSVIKARYIYRSIMASYVRLGEFNKAEYWRQRYFPGLSVESGRVYVAHFIHDSGWIALTRGDLSGARSALLRKIRLYRNMRPDRDLGKACQMLAIVALYRSDREEYAYYRKKAHDVFEKLGDQASIVDLMFLDVLDRIYGGGSDSKDELISVAELLTEQRDYYFGCEALFHILVDPPPGNAWADSEGIRRLILRVSRSRSPLCKAVTYLLEFNEVPRSAQLRSLHLLKSAYKTLEDCGQTFLMMLISERIAGCYLEASRESLAKKFLVNAHKIAEKRIGNRTIADALRARIDSIGQDQTEKRKMVQTIFSISNILQDIRNYDETLNALIHYAVDVTGAERGALLLKRADSNDLQAKAYLNCDDDSLRDIVDFSRSVARTVVESEHPLIVDNALDDKRTRGYKSIIAHNILSVICIPVYRANEVLGVLYLDHHTIPALFTDEDIEFIRAMANFLSHIVTMARDFRTASVVTREYLNELRVTGARHQQLITRNSTMVSLLQELPSIARSDASVMIVGESGTGKEILCELTHALSNRSDQPLVKLNCAAIPTNEIESELFGVARNAFTGVSEREGKFSAADGGTMFLDEIADMPLSIQGKVLRVLEYQEFEKLGSNRTITTDVRFVYATNKDLSELVMQGAFREDLFHRIHRIVIEIPPLRERLDDIPFLIEYFAKLFSAGKRSAPAFPDETIEALMHYSWPGNVRELKNLVERFCILRPGKSVHVGDLPRTMLNSISDRSRSKEVSRSLEKALILRLLKENNGVKSVVARILGIPPSTLQRRIRSYGLEN